MSMNHENLQGAVLRMLKTIAMAIFVLFAVSGAANATKLVFEKNCTESQRKSVKEAFAAAGPQTNQAASALSGSKWNATTTALYTKWFGTAREDLVQTARSTLDAMKQRFSDKVTFTVECNPPRLSADTYAATVFQSDYIAFAPLFFAAPLKGPNSQVGTLLHEMSHNAADTDDIDGAYGREGAGQLARSNPNQAVRNADNYEFFIEDRSMSK